MYPQICAVLSFVFDDLLIFSCFIQSFTELDEVVQSLATGEIADSVREIASFRTKIKDIGSKVKAIIKPQIGFTWCFQVFEMDAEVEEMTRDRRNNILIHGLPVQVREKNYNAIQKYLKLLILSSVSQSVINCKLYPRQQ